MHDSRLPALNGLRAFEVAARHLSFKQAAEELFVTPAAVSHRIRALEDWLGVKLFNRLTRSLELTKEGEAYAALVQEGFAILTRASEELRQSTDAGELVVSATMSFASNWLNAKLPTLQGAPALQNTSENFTVRIEGTDLPADLNRSNIDIAIRYGEGGYEDLHSEMLFPDLITPVCTPELAAEISQPGDIAKLPRIDYRWSGFGPRDPSWEKWFRAAGVAGGAPADPDPMPSFSDEHMALGQTLAGRGVGLLGIVAAAEPILQGRLVRPFPIALENRAYYFVCQPHSLRRRKVEIFRDWLKAEAARFDALLAEDPRLKFETILRAEHLTEKP